MLCLNQVMYGRTSRHNALGEVVYAKTFKRNRMEMFVKHFVGVVVGEDPVIENSEVIFCAKQVDEIFPFVALYQHLRGIEALQQLVNVFVSALCK